MKNLFELIFPDHCAFWIYLNKNSESESYVTNLRNFAIHRLSNHNRNNEKLSKFECFLRRISILFWPLTTVVRAGVVTFKLRNSKDSDFLSTSILRHFYSSIFFALRFNLAPKAYYKFRLFLPKNKNRIGLYLQDHEMAIILRFINSNIKEAAVNKIDDKLDFFKFFSENQISIAPVHAYCKNGGEVNWLVESSNFEEGVVLKVTNLAAGEGIEVLEFNNGYWNTASTRLTKHDLIQRLQYKSINTTSILQPRLRNNSALKPFAGEGLSTVRVLTVSDGVHSSKLIAATMRMPVGASKVDNIGSGGMAVSVETSTGTLVGPAVKKGIETGWYIKHPNSNTPIQDVKLPFWTEVNSLVIKAHNLVPDIPSVGWDVAILETGPVLIEGNTGWDSELIQILGRVPLGEFPVIKILNQTLWKIQT